ncbi:MAG TPA: discoidin domain-containing protein, partial [Rhodothermales bacterium]|nr:discoidin domain-containing protein [Rhodothermales bacterium]
MRFLLLTLFLLLALPAGAQERVLADGESLDGWTAVTPEGVSLRLSLDEGRTGRAIRLDYDFNGHGGYAIARRELDLTLPENYRFRWWLRAEGPDGALPPVQDLEFKLVDPSGQSVWWHNRRRFEYPARWARLATRARHMSFAWGPASGAAPGRLGSLEFVVTAATGGRGTVWIDDVTYEALPPEGPYTGTPVATANVNEADATHVLDGDPATTWTASSGTPRLTLDFGLSREFGALTLDWGAHAAADYDVELSDDGQTWTTARRIRDGNGGRDRLYMPETEARYLRLHFLRGREGYELAEVGVEPVAFSATPNEWLQNVAGQAPRGRYPRSLLRSGTFWTVIGADRDEAEALVGEDGEVEVGSRRFTLEPFLYTGGRLLSWADSDTTTQALAHHTLPLPSITRRHGGLALETTAFVAGDSGRAVLYVRYRVEGNDEPVRLLLAARPWGVNPPYQWLNVSGGWAPVRDVRVDGGALVIDGRPVVPLGPVAAMGAASSGMGDVSDWLATGTVPPAQAAFDSLGFAGGALAFDVAPGEDVWVAVPMDGSTERPAGGLPADEVAQVGQGVLAATEARWIQRL